MALLMLFRWRSRDKNMIHAQSMIRKSICQNDKESATGFSKYDIEGENPRDKRGTHFSDELLLLVG